MKLIKRALATMTVVVMALSCVLANNVSNVWAKSTVKSVKVAGVKKKVTMKVGSKKTLKVNIKASKSKFKKFTVKSSNKKVVKVKKKSNKIILTALKVGKAKITVKSKANKKKKTVFTVVVTKKTSKKDEPVIVNSDPTFKVTTLSNDTFVLSFDKEVNIDMDSIVVDYKSSAKASYIAKDKVVGISTDNKKDYSIVTDSSFDNGNYVRFAVPSVNKAYSVEQEINVKYSPSTYDDRLYVEANAEFEESVWTDYGHGAYKLNSITNVPEGVTYEFDQNGKLTFKGEIKKAGVYAVTAVVEDEMGTVNTFNIVILAGDEDNLVVYFPEKEIYSYNKDGYSVSFEEMIDFYTSGGSGSVECEIVSGDSNFSVDEYYDSEEGETYSNIILKGDKPGVYSAKIKVSDAENPTLYKVVDYKVTVKEYKRISGKVVNQDGKAIPNAYVMATPYDDGITAGYDQTDENGEYNIYVAPSHFNVYATLETGDKVTRTTVPNVDATKDVVANITIKGVYIVTVKPEQNITFLGWHPYDEEGYWEESICDGNVFALPMGTYNLASRGFYSEDGKLYEYTATIEFKVEGNVEVVPTITQEEIPIKANLTVGTNNITQTWGEDVYYKFTPSTDGEYRFKSNFPAKDDPAFEIMDETGETIVYSDDDDENLNFDAYAELKKNHTYFVRLYVQTSSPDDGGDETAVGTVNISSVLK